MQPLPADPSPAGSQAVPNLQRPGYPPDAYLPPTNGYFAGQIPDAYGSGWVGGGAGGMPVQSAVVDIQVQGAHPAGPAGAPAAGGGVGAATAGKSGRGCWGCWWASVGVQGCAGAPACCSWRAWVVHVGCSTAIVAACALSACHRLSGGLVLLRLQAGSSSLHTARRRRQLLGSQQALRQRWVDSHRQR